MLLSSLDKYPGVELLDHMVVLYLIFWGTSILFSLAVPIYFPTNSAQRFLFSTSSPTRGISCLFVESHSDRREMITHCSFDIHFLMINNVEHFFHVSIAHLYDFFGNISAQVLCHFLVSLFLFLFLILSCMSSSYILNVSLNISFENIFSNSLGCLFISLMVSFIVQNSTAFSW